MNSLNLDNYMKFGKGITMSQNSKEAGREALVVLMQKKPLPCSPGIMENWRACFHLYKTAFSLLFIVLLLFLLYIGATIFFGQL